VDVKKSIRLKSQIGLQLWKTWMMMMICGHELGFGKYKNIKAPATDTVSYYEMTQHKSWSDKECSKLLHQR
jgi:hypothetical protein